MDFEVVSAFEIYLLPFFQINTEPLFCLLHFVTLGMSFEVNFALIGRRFRLQGCLVSNELIFR